MVSSTVDVHERYGDELVVIVMNVLEEPEAVRAFTGEQGMAYLNLIANEDTLRAYGVRGHPLTVLITPDRGIAQTYFGYVDGETLDTGVRALVRLE
jgi:hypothetical protein